MTELSSDASIGRGLSSLTVAALRTRAAELCLPVKSKARKADIVSMIEARLSRPTRAERREFERSLRLNNDGSAKRRPSQVKFPS